MLKTLRTYVEGLEVWKNAYWEWEDAIFEGCEVFFQLRQHRQGTVRVDLESRRLTFSPMVAADVSGSTVGLGMGTAAADGEEESRNVLSEAEREWARSQGTLAHTLAAKRALFDALGLSQNTSTPWDELELRIFDRNRMSVNSSGQVQNRIWAMRAVEYKVAFTAAAGHVFCTVAAIADAGDLGK